MKERARHEHRLDAHDEAEHPPHLRPGVGAQKEDRRAEGEHDRARDVQPSAQQRTRRRVAVPAAVIEGTLSP